MKKNPNGQAYSSLGVITKGTIIEVCWPRCARCVVLCALCCAKPAAAVRH